MNEKIEDIRGIANISGFGGGYEQACQDMLQAGWVWLNKNGHIELTATTYKHIYGIFEPNSPEAKELSNIIVKEVDDCSGAMHQAVMGHLFYIHKNGLEKWKKELSLSFPSRC